MGAKPPARPLTQESSGAKPEPRARTGRAEPCLPSGGEAAVGRTKFSIRACFTSGGEAALSRTKFSIRACLTSGGKAAVVNPNDLCKATFSLLRFFNWFSAATAGQQVKHRHSYCHSVCYLVENQRPAAVRNLGGDLNPAIHRSGMHDDGVLRRALEMSRLQTVVNGVLAHRRKERRVLSLALNSQDHDDVGVLDRFVDFSDLDASLFDLAAGFLETPKGLDRQQVGVGLGVLVPPSAATLTAAFAAPPGKVSVSS